MQRIKNLFRGKQLYREKQAAKAILAVKCQKFCDGEVSYHAFLMMLSKKMKKNLIRFAK